ncbi:MAG: mechanosensitive ion channel family protein [bacterium]
MDSLPYTVVIREWIDFVHVWLVEKVLIPESLVQAGILVAIAIVALMVGSPVRKALSRRFDHFISARIHSRSFLRELLRLIPVIFALMLIWFALLAGRVLQTPTLILGLVETLLVAWVVIRLLTSIILDRFWAKMIATFAWTVAALHILNLYEPIVEFLGELGLVLGDIRLTALSIIKATIIFVLLFKIGSWLTDNLNRRLETISDLTPSTHVLISKLVKIFLLTMIVLIALSSVGIDFTALAVFSGAVGVGIGFGLQKVVANLISGIILLLDRSIKPGDVIQIGDVYGWISNLQARFVSVVTREGKEYLIPNEDLITQQVINWSYSNKRVRLSVPIGISYKADPKQARTLILQAVEGMSRILSNPAPVCLMKGFGDSSVDLELRFWIQDPEGGVSNIKSQVLFRVWDLFQEHSIEIPFPQRDVHLDIQPSSGALKVEKS